MNSVLVVSSNEKATNLIISMMKDYGRLQISIAKTSTEAKRVVGLNEYDLVIINSPLSDDYGKELAEIVVTSSNASCLILVKSEHFDNVSLSLENIGVMAIEKPINVAAFSQGIRFINASRNRLLGLKQENSKLQKRIDDMRLINRAKFALMQYLSFDENQAHKYLEKQAMDKRLTKREVAMQVIKIYEN